MYQASKEHSYGIQLLYLEEIVLRPTPCGHKETMAIINAEDQYLGRDR